MIDENVKFFLSISLSKFNKNNKNQFYLINHVELNIFFTTSIFKIQTYKKKSIKKQKSIIYSKTTQCLTILSNHKNKNSIHFLCLTIWSIIILLWGFLKLNASKMTWTNFSKINDENCFVWIFNNWFFSKKISISKTKIND